MLMKDLTRSGLYQLWFVSMAHNMRYKDSIFIQPLAFGLSRELVNIECAHSNISGIYFLLLVSGQFNPLWFGFGNYIFTQKKPNFEINFPSGQKIALGQVKKYPSQRRVGLSFTAGQKYAQIYK